MTREEPHIVDIAPDDHRLVTDALPVLQELRPHLTLETFVAIYREGYAQGLRFTLAYRGKACVGVAGWRVMATTVAGGRKLHVDDLVTTASGRSTGVGKALLAVLHQRAADAECSMLDLDSAVHRFDAHRFYMREGMVISAHHFMRPTT